MALAWFGSLGTEKEDAFTQGRKVSNSALH